MTFKNEIMRKVLSFYFIGCLTSGVQPTPLLKAQSRIIGGTEVSMESHTHMAAITGGAILTTFICGGSIVGQRSILTAAHCVEPLYAQGALSSVIRARLGSTQWQVGGISYLITSNSTHPHFVPNSYKNDLTILYTTLAIVYTTFIQPINISFAYVGLGVVANVAGWGTNEFADEMTSMQSLHETQLSTLSGSQCINAIRQSANNFNVTVPGVEPHIELCAVHEEGVNNGVCSGDDGSGLVRRDTGSLVGLVSWFLPCARGAPDVFVRLGAYRPWITQHIRN